MDGEMVAVDVVVQKQKRSQEKSEVTSRCWTLNGHKEERETTAMSAIIIKYSHAIEIGLKTYLQTRLLSIMSTPIE